MAARKKEPVRIGIYYDGHYFYKVSNYYKFDHPRQARISILGLHNYISNEISTRLKLDIDNCKLVEAHYFRGRSMKNANEKAIVGERYFEDALTKEGVDLHYLPLVRGNNNEPKEKGIDVSLALDAYKKATAKSIDILVLIAGDGDYLPLVRELQTMSSPIDVMLLSWDFETTNGDLTLTSQDLLEEVKYPIQMANVIDDRLNLKNPFILGLFEPRQFDQGQNLASLQTANTAAAYTPAFYPGAGQSSPLQSSPLQSSPLQSSPLQSSPLQSSPLQSSPLHSPPLQAPLLQSSPLQASPLQTLPFDTGYSPQGYSSALPSFASKRKALTEAELAQERISTILSLDSSGGWIRDVEYNNFYFFYTDVINKKPEELTPGMTLQFRLKYDRIKTEQKDNGEPSYRAVGPIYAVD